MINKVEDFNWTPVFSCVSSCSDQDPRNGDKTGENGGPSDADGAPEFEVRSLSLFHAVSPLTGGLSARLIRDSNRKSASDFVNARV